MTLAMVMPRETARTTNPNAPMSVATGRTLALHFVYPPALDGLVIDLVPHLELGREAPSAGEATASSHRSGGYAVIPHGTVSRRHATVGASIGGTIPTLIDHGGRNGTYVDGVAVKGTVPLTRHSVVRLGEALAVVDERADEPAPTDVRLPGQSGAILRLREALPRVAASRSPVLVSGETGTGKEVTASELHRHSGRAGPLVTFNCAELSPHLVESQLFGHQRGAFTGATSASAGLFVAADGGSLFLDEVGEIPSAVAAESAGSANPASAAAESGMS